MKMPNLKYLTAASLLSVCPLLVNAMDSDDPTLTKVTIDQLEHRFHGSDSHQVLEGDIWIGKDLNKAWFKVDAERSHSELEELNLQTLWSHAVSPYWDVQLGLSHDTRTEPERTRGVVALNGLAPYFWESDISLYVADDGRLSLDSSFELELMFTQKLVLVPELSLSAHSSTEEDFSEGQGLAKFSAAVRLKYEIVREFAPYIGVTWDRALGKTAELAEDNGENPASTAWVAGVSIWF